MPGGLLLLTGVFALAMVLRETVSLPLAMVATIPLGLACGAFLLTATGGFLDQLVEWFGQFLADVNRSLKERDETAATLTAPGVVQVAGLLAAGNAALCAVSLLLARYWQAMLYNPGGFGVEFRRLRLPMGWTLILATLVAGLTLTSDELSGWAIVFAVPLTFCGFALLHSWIRAKRIGRTTVITSYLMWLVFDPIKLALLAMVVVDAFVDIRSRWPAEEDTSESSLD